jgi:hypothetical protein
LPVVGAIAPRAEPSSPGPRSGDRGIFEDNWVSLRPGPQSSRLLGREGMATVLAFASFDRSAHAHDSP